MIDNPSADKASTDSLHASSASGLLQTSRSCPVTRKAVKPEGYLPSSPELEALFNKFKALKVESEQLHWDAYPESDDSGLYLPSKPGQLDENIIKLVLDEQSTRATLVTQPKPALSVVTSDKEINSLIAKKQSIHDLMADYCKLMQNRAATPEQFEAHLGLFSQLKTDWDMESLIDLYSVMQNHNCFQSNRIRFTAKLINPTILSGDIQALLGILKGHQAVWEIRNQEKRWQKRSISAQSHAQWLPLAPADSSGKRSLVIIKANQLDPSRTGWPIFIGAGHHFFVSQRQRTVYFAGNIWFDKTGQVTEIDNHSGGYHFPQGESQTISAQRFKHQQLLLNEVGLPGNLLNSRYQTTACPRTNFTPKLAIRNTW